MSKLNLISLATVKSQLGITVSTGDTALTNAIPMVSADIRRILNTGYNRYASCTCSIGSDQLLISYYNGFELEVGTVIQCDGFADDTYVIAIDETTGYHTMSSNCIADATILYPTINVYQWLTIAKMIWYKVSKSNTIGIAKERGISSESFGPISLSYSNKDINNKYQYPSSLIDDLGTPNACVG